ncbi:ATP-dependent DNA helicase [Pseudohyphozyma bogoriensis]|nr:ATP-dependent DNA helicase [Pseudohyphozyma bogoriensis]
MHQKSWDPWAAVEVGAAWALLGAMSAVPLVCFAYLLYTLHVPLQHLTFFSGLRRYVCISYSLAEVLHYVHYRYLAYQAQARHDPPNHDRSFIQSVFERCMMSGWERDEPSESIAKEVLGGLVDADEAGTGAKGERFSRLEWDDPRAVDFREFIVLWFHGARYEDLRREDLREWLAWVFYHQPLEELLSEHPLTRYPDDKLSLIDEAIQVVEARAGRTIRPGRNNAISSIRLNLDPIKVYSRPLWIYLLIAVLQRLSVWGLEGEGFKKCSLGTTQYLIRMPTYWKPSRNSPERTRPLIFLHGLGTGMASYSNLMHHLAAYRDRPILVPLQPHISMSFFHPSYLKAKDEKEYVEDLRKIVELWGFEESGVTVLSHSKGTIVHSWLLKAMPESIKRSCFIDPVVFCLWEPYVCHNFIHKPAKTAREILMRHVLLSPASQFQSTNLSLPPFNSYFVSRELGIALTLQRSFSWSSNLLFPSSIPSLSSEYHTKVILAGDDEIINTRRVHQYLVREKVGVEVQKGRNHGGVLAERGVLDKVRPQDAVGRGHVLEFLAKIPSCFARAPLSATDTSHHFRVGSAGKREMLQDEPYDIDALLAEAEVEASPPQQEEEPPEDVAERPLVQTTLFEPKSQTPEQYLPALNANQRKAVVHPPVGGLQILAGPGSAVVDKVVMGTFHAICVRFLRRWGRLVCLPSNFIIAGRDDCLASIKRILAAASDRELKPNTLCDFISKCKSSNQTPDDYREYIESVDMSPMMREDAYVKAKYYEEYEAALKADNALDFDDLLVYGLKLVSDNPRLMSNVETVLIDEFQDTNVVQYALVKAISHARESLTIVGDPDQSIYGWRHADVENLRKMEKDFKPVVQILLEENYRSTGAILGAATAIVQQDTKRIKKTLKATHPSGISTVLHKVGGAQEEGDYIARQIKHIIAHTGGLIDYGDIAILLRYQALSRSIEVALQKAGIPSRMVGGHKFFERKEVQDLLSYLQLVDCLSYTSAFARVVNTPKRGIGEKTVRDILAAAKLRKISAFEVCVRVVNGSGVVGVTTAQKKGLRQFVKVVLELGKAAEAGASVAELIAAIVKETDYIAHLERTHGSSDTKERQENIEELKAYATLVAEEHPEGVEEESKLEEELHSDDVDVEVPKDDEEDEIELTSSVNGDREPAVVVQDDGEEVVMPDSSQTAREAPNPLRTFLAVSMLATDTETEASKTDASEKKVVLSTCHAAKGLEWPVVFVPACENGTYPFFRASGTEEVDEERRLLYVAITRAQAFCTLTHAAFRMAGAETKSKDISPFLEVATKYPSLFTPKLQLITEKTRLDIAKVIHRPPVDEETTKIGIQQYESTLPPEPTYDAYNGGSQYSQGRYSNQSSGSRSWSNSPSGSPGKSYGAGWKSTGPASIPVGAGGFRSALAAHRSSGGVATTTTTAGFAPASSLSGEKQGFAWKNGPQGIVPASSRTASAPRPSTTAPPSGIARSASTGSSGSTASSSTASGFQSFATTHTAPVVQSTTAGFAQSTATRKVNDALMVNPRMNPGPDLLSTFQSAESEALSSFSTLGSPDSKANKGAPVSRASVDSVGSKPGKRWSDGLPKKAAPAKKAKK